MVEKCPKESKIEKKSSKNFPICPPKLSISESKRGQNREKIKQNFIFWRTKPSKKCVQKMPKFQKNPIWRSKTPKKCEKLYKNDNFQR